MLTSTRRLASISLTFAVGIALVGPSARPVAALTLPAFDASTLSVARADLATMVNRQRLAHGLVAVRVDAQATSLAASRAEAMAALDALGHAGADGRTTFDLIRASGMTWFGAGEVLAFNTYPGEPESTGQAVADWLASPTHTAIVLSSTYNYVGFAAAVSASGTRYYAGVFLQLPDRTPGWATAGPTTTAAVDAARAKVTLRWTGGDVRLQVLTAGLRDYEVQRRLAGGTWQLVAVTTRPSLSVTVARGRLYEFRVRSRDRAGNRSAWSSVSVRT